MKKTAVIILAEGFEEIEAITPIDILRRCGINVIIAGLETLSIKGARNIIVNADCLFEDIPKEIDALILPGGKGADILGNSLKVKNLVITLNNEKKLIAAICAAPAVILSPLGILKGKKMTCFPACIEELNKEDIYAKNSVVKDDNLITSKGPATSSEFSFIIAESLTDSNICEKVKKAMLYI